ncbi:hypothetical protein WBG78_28865 [Chryseolinea sp. T2]|uniref:hypothetical protein n=1 Tax=Chryseolinea sp. T2 TaxID=3129255 RepID=UPI0030779270
MEKTAAKPKPAALNGNGVESNEDDNYIVSVDLDYDGKPGQKVRHFLYGSQVYDTMFGVYGIFEGKKTDSAFVIEKITLELVNYKGLINVGFTDDRLTFGKAPKKISPQTFEENSLYFFVQGTSLTTTKRLELDSPIKIAKGQRLPIALKRMLCPLPESVAPAARGEGKKTPHGQIFDSEFYYRNGVDLAEQDPRPGQFNPNKPATEVSGGETDMPSLRCHQSNINLFY